MSIEIKHKKGFVLSQKIFGDILGKKVIGQVEKILTGDGTTEEIEITSVSQLYHLLVQFKGEFLEVLKGKEEEGDAIMNNEDYILKLADLLLQGSEFDNLYHKYEEEKKAQRNSFNFEKFLQRYGYKEVKIYLYNEDDKKEMKQDFLDGKIRLDDLKLVISFMCSNEFGSLTNNLTYEMSKFFLPILRDKNTLSILKEVSNKIKFSTFCKYINASEKNTPAALYKIFTNNISSQIVDYFNDYKTLWYGIF